MRKGKLCRHVQCAYNTGNRWFKFLIREIRKIILYALSVRVFMLIPGETGDFMMHQNEDVAIKAEKLCFE